VQQAAGRTSSSLFLLCVGNQNERCRPRRGPLDLENRPAGLGRLGTASPATQKIPRRVLHAPTLGTSYSTALNGHYDTVMSCSLANSMRMPGYIQSKASSLSNSRSVTMPRHFFVDP
jgi:hypothetical protein